jgi:hypothetical protein
VEREDDKVYKSPFQVMPFIPPLSPGNRLPSRKAAVACLLLAGMLSMLCAEVFSGASVLWIVQPWGWLVTLPLYFAHLVFFLNLALYFRRTSIPALYLWGVLFALYESWITKVAWAGYMNQAPQIQTVLGFAAGESLIILLFWHPVMSFIVPILIYEALSVASSGQKPVLAGHAALLLKNRRNLAALGGVALIGAVFLAMNSQWNVGAALVTFLATVLFIGVLYRAAERWSGGEFSIFSLSLGKRGFIVLTLYLILLYLVAFFGLFPERIAPPLTLLLTLLIYAAVLFAIFRDPQVTEPATTMAAGEEFIGIIDMLKYVFGIAVLILLLCLVPTIAYPLGAGIYLLLMAAGPVLAVLAVREILRRGRQTPDMSQG